MNILFNILHILYIITLYADLPLIISPLQLHHVIVIVGHVRGIDTHTFTMSEVVSRGKTFILATESMPHGCTDLFSNIEDAALFLFWKFARYSPRENDKIQISYALLYSPDTFINTTMLTASLTAGKSSLAGKLKGMKGYRPSRSCSKNHVNYSDNINNIPNRQEQLPVKPSKKKGSKKKGKKSVSPRKQLIPCENHAAGLGNAASNPADEGARGSNIFSGKPIHSITRFVNLPSREGSCECGRQ